MINPHAAASLERQSSDVAAAQAGRQLVSIIDSADDAVVGKDLSGIILSWNQGAERLFGHSAADVIGQPIGLLIPPDRVEEDSRVLERIGRGERVGHYETVRRRQDGSLIDISLQVSPITDGSGRIIGASEIARDITGRKRAEESLAKRIEEQTALFEFTDSLFRAGSAEEVYEAALDAILRALRCDRASILRFDDAGVMRFVAWRGLSDRYRKAVEGHSPWTPGTRDPHPIYVNDIAAADEPEPLKATIAQEGIRALAFVPILANATVIGKFMTYYDRRHSFDDHEMNLALTIARQLGFSLERMQAEAARQAAEAALRETEERFRLMSEQAPVMLWISDTDGRCLHLNRMLREFWGVGESQVDGFDWQSTMHPDDAAEISGRIAEALASRRSVSIEGRYRSANGRYRVLQTEARPRFSSSGEFLGMVGVNVDVTEREEAEGALRESEERFRLAVEATLSSTVRCRPQPGGWRSSGPRQSGRNRASSWFGGRSPGHQCDRRDVAASVFE